MRDCECVYECECNNECFWQTWTWTVVFFFDVFGEYVQWQPKYEMRVVEAPLALTPLLLLPPLVKLSFSCNYFTIDQCRQSSVSQSISQTVTQSVSRAVNPQACIELFMAVNYATSHHMRSIEIEIEQKSTNLES